MVLAVPTSTSNLIGRSFFRLAGVLWAAVPQAAAARALLPAASTPHEAKTGTCQEG